MSTTITPAIPQSVGSGLAGAIALTILHETVRQFVPDAPRADILGKRGIVKLFRKAGEQPPTNDKLYPLSMLGEVLSNTAYYSLVGIGDKLPILTGVALGVLAGVGAVALPGPMGLGEKPTIRTWSTAAMTVGWYIVGGLVAGSVYNRLKSANP